MSVIHELSRTLSKGNVAVSLDKVEQALKDNTDAKILAFVHAETSTGARSDAKALCKIAHDNDCITIVDAVTSPNHLLPQQPHHQNG
jgi:aspartate aminotransferase-like enzyme